MKTTSEKPASILSPLRGTRIRAGAFENRRKGSLKKNAVQSHTHGLIVDSVRSSRWSTLLLGCLASIGILLLRTQGTQFPIWLYVEYAVAAVVVCAVCASQQFLKLSLTRWDAVSFCKLAVPLLLILMPTLSSLLQVRVCGGTGEATELIWLASVQYAAIWLAATSSTSRQEWTSFLLSCFLMIFGIATSDREGMFYVVVPFGLFASWWMMSRYWQTIEAGFVAVEHVPLVRLRLIAIIGVVGGTSLIAYCVHTQGPVMHVLDGFMPTSGGKQRADSAARQGVGDGDMLVAAKDEAYTFGPVDSDLFLDSQMPSMYDLASEVYGEPTPRIRQYSRAISLQSQVQEAQEEGSESKQNGREFSSLRQPQRTGDATKPGSKDSRAVFYLIGEVPLHLRVESYDEFDGVIWRNSPHVNFTKSYSQPTLLDIAGKPWMHLQQYSQDLVVPQRNRLSIKVIGMKSPRLPSPSLLTNVHIDRVDQEDFFSWTADGQLMMPNREYVPQLTVAHMLYQIPKLHPLRHSDSMFGRLSHDTRLHNHSEGFPNHKSWVTAYLQTHASRHHLREFVDRIISQSENLAGGTPTDWQRVEAITAWMRTNIHHDPLATPPTDCNDTVAYLLEHKRGPDYLIASATTMLIRSLGIPSRLATGFYASPDHYDMKAGQTEVLPEHLHTWTEVYCHGLWIPVEPTEGFAVPREFRTWTQWAAECVWAMRAAIVRHPFAFAAGCLLFVIVVYARRQIGNSLISIMLLPTAAAPLQLRLKWMTRLTLIRLWIMGNARPAKLTIRQLVESQLARIPSVSVSDREIYILALQRLAYAPAQSKASTLRENASELRRVCWAIHRCGIFPTVRSLSSRS